MRNLTQDDHNQGFCFPNLGHFLATFEKEQGRSFPLPLLVTRLHITIKNFKE